MAGPFSPPAINHLWKPLVKRQARCPWPKVSMTHYPISLAVYLSHGGPASRTQKGTAMGQQKGSRGATGMQSGHRWVSGSEIRITGLLQSGEKETASLAKSACQLPGKGMSQRAFYAHPRFSPSQQPRACPKSFNPAQGDSHHPASLPLWQLSEHWFPRVTSI